MDASSLVLFLTESKAFPYLTYAYFGHAASAILKIHFTDRNSNMIDRHYQLNNYLSN
jgi:hypothetical protein